MSYTARAGHGWWCRAKTYSTRCRHCRGKVFYFECNCGSKVFFDSLGHLWPEHHGLENVTSQYGREAIGRLMSQWMMTPGSRMGRAVEPSYEERIEKAVLRPRANRIVRRDPIKDVHVHAIGSVREFAEVDVYEAQDFPRGVVGAAAVDR